MSVSAPPSTTSNNNKVAVLVGATGQLGPAIAQELSRRGVTLVLVGPQREGLDALRRGLTERGTPAMIHVAEAMDAEEMQGLADAVSARFHRADILLHLAGGFRSGTLLETPPEIWDSVFDLNLHSAINSIRAFLPLLTANQWGRIITVSSGITLAPAPNAVAYVTAKAALETMTLAVAQEFKDRGVTANVVLIRALDTPAERAKQPDKKTGWVTPEQVAATVSFLCSDAAGAITGARIPVLGGT